MKLFSLMLAPIEGKTDASFRETCYLEGCDFTFTEMARISALARGNKSTWARIKIKNSVPTYIQLIGSNVNHLRKFLEKFMPEDGFMGFNLNLGCPSSKMVGSGLGCALIKRISRVKEMVSVIKESGYSVSIKLRLGMNAYEKEKKNYLNLINEVDCDFFIVHARHGKETYRNNADFSVYEECVKTGKIIIANGDIKSKEQVKFLKSVGVRGVMIGRAAIDDPTIFGRLV